MPRTPDPGALRVAVPPYVDTAMTVVGVKDDLFQKQGVLIKLVDTTWENQFELVAGGALDISMSTVDEFVNKDRNLRAANRRVIYFLPAWQFRGLGFYTSGGFKTLADLQKSSGADAGLTQFVSQLTDRKVVFPEGSVFETALREFLRKAGTDPNRIEIINAPLDTALNALSDRSVVLAAVGSQQRFEAERRGYREAIPPESLGLDVITGFVVRDEIWNRRRDDVLNFACAWYATVRAVNSSNDHGFNTISSYLADRGAGTLTENEYTLLRKYNVFASTPAQARVLFFESEGTGFWRRAWNLATATMQASGREDEIPPDDAGFVAPSINLDLIEKCPG